MIGHSLPPAEKRRVCVEARKHCKTPILELYGDGTPELVEETSMYAHQSRQPEDFLDAVHSILRPSERS